MFSVLRELDPDGIAKRTFRQNHNCSHGQYIVPGPNWVWHVDGYHKLTPYVFEIYMGIYAYS